MAIFAIADLHLSFGVDKPMDIFGEKWKDHHITLTNNWKQRITGDDWVIIPGDISWGLHRTEILPDLDFIDKLPGKKIIIKGNHDIWWGTAKKNRELLEENGFETIRFMYNEAIKIDDVIICGTRGWLCPGDKDFNKEDISVYNKEVARLLNSIHCAYSLKENNEEIICFMHYPPFGNISCTQTGALSEHTEFTKIIEENGIKRCFFGHVHSPDKQKSCHIDSLVTEYKLIAADFIDFLPLRIQ